MSEYGKAMDAWRKKERKRMLSETWRSSPDAETPEAIEAMDELARMAVAAKAAGA